VIATRAVPVVTVPVIQSVSVLPLSNQFAALADDIELTADEKWEAEHEKLSRRLHALLADTPESLLDKIFGEGKRTIDLDNPMFADLATEFDDDERLTPGSVIVSPPPPPVVTDDELIATFVTQDRAKLADSKVSLDDIRSRMSEGVTKPKVKRRSKCDPSSEASLVADSSGDELQFSPMLFAAVQSELSVPCTVDACAADGGTNALLPTYCSPSNSFFSCDLSQPAMLWLHTPRRNREAFLQRYVKAAAANPQLGAIILLPAKYTSAVVKRMPILRRYHRGTPMFVDTVTNQVVKAKCDFVLYVDAPALVPVPMYTMKSAQPESTTASTCAAHQQSAATHVMQLVGSVAGAPARVLLDSGAETYHLMSVSFCQRIGLSIRPSRHTIQIEGIHQGVGDVCGVTTATITLGSYKVSLNFLVIHMPTAFDVILGDAWLKSCHAVLDYAAHTCKVHKGKHVHTLHLRSVGGDRCDNDVPHVKGSVHKCVMSYVQAKRILKQPMWHCLMVVRVLPTVASICEVADATHAKLKSEYPEVFTDNPPHGGSKLRIDFEVIPIPDVTNPVLRPMYRYSPLEMEEMERQIHKLLELGYIRPSQSPYGAPVLFVKKPRSTELRMVIDYRALNKLTKRNGFPLPRIDEMLDHLGDATTFSLIDLRQAYHQCKLVDSDVPKTAFRTPFGHFEYVTLSFGLTNAPAAFQSVMNGMFSKYLYKFVMVYLDDILVFSKTAVEHEKHLRIILDILKANNLTVAIEKCKFFQSEVLFLGHIVSAQGVQVDPTKVKAVRQFPRPLDVGHLRSFLGLTNYFRRFIKDYARVVHPLTDLLKLNVKWNWSLVCERAFEQVKQLLTTAPVLALPDWRSHKSFDMVCDASQLGVGGMLLQDQKPIAFESRKLTAAECNYSPTELEMLAVVYCTKKWRCYIEGRAVNVYTDHKPNTYFATTSMMSRRSARWLEDLQGYDFVWHYKPGPQNVVADALSRHPVVGTSLVLLGTLTSTSPLMKLTDSVSFMDAIKQAYERDPWFTDFVNIKPLSCRQGLYYIGEMLVLPNDAHLKTIVLSECHDTPYSGHVGRTKTLHRVQRHFWWPTVTADVRRFVASCDSCQRHKASNRRPGGLLQPLPVPTDTWSSVSMDLIVSLPQTAAGYTAIAVFVDRLSKMVRLAPCRDDTSAEQFADLFVEHVFRSHGLPATIVSDRDPRFTSGVWQALMTRLQVTHSMSSAFHPQSDGNTERVNRVLEDMLRHFVDPTQSNWDKLLPLVEFAINDSYHESVRAVPFVLVYGRRPRVPLDLVLKGEGSADALVSTSDTADAVVSTIQDAVCRARKCLEAAQQRQKAYADRVRRDVSFVVGTDVLLSTKHINLQMKGTPKLLPRWIGPFKVVKQVGSVAYQLELPANLKIHPVFHVSLLKAYVPGRVAPPPPPDMVDGVEEWEVEAILSHKDVKVRRKRNRQRTPVFARKYLVKWKGYDESHNTWEPEANCTNAQEFIDEYFARAKQGVASNKKRKHGVVNDDVHGARSTRVRARGT
jgi:hypothetical protein